VPLHKEIGCLKDGYDDLKTLVINTNPSGIYINIFMSISHFCKIILSTFILDMYTTITQKFLVRISIWIHQYFQ